MSNKHELTKNPFLCSWLGDCGEKTCDNGEVLDENCQCYCSDDDNCATKDDKRNGAGETL